jgi:hypothetical protein
MIMPTKVSKFIDPEADRQQPPSMEGCGMSDSREAFEQLHAIPSGAIWCENRDVYIHKNYSGLVLHPINESWEAFCEGALWQANREAVESEAVTWLWVVNGHRAVVPKDYADELIEDGETVLPLYTHPASADNQAHWSQGSPRLADQYRQEAFAAREALGFSCDSLEVSPADITQAIADKQAASVPERSELIDLLISTRNQSEGATADLILGLIWRGKQEGQ